jgi:hypothetical protein
MIKQFIKFVSGVSILILATSCGGKSNSAVEDLFSEQGYVSISGAEAANLTISEQNAVMIVLDNTSSKAFALGMTSSQNSHSPTALMTDKIDFTAECDKSGVVDITGDMGIEAEERQMKAEWTMKLSTDGCSDSNGAWSGSVDSKGIVVVKVPSSNSSVQDMEFTAASSLSGSITAEGKIEPGVIGQHALEFKDFGIGFKFDGEVFTSQASGPALIEKLEEAYLCKGTLLVDGKSYSCASILKMQMENQNLGFTF